MAQESSIMELDQIITSHQCALSWIPRSHPAYTTCIHLLATLRFQRFQLSEQKQDLNKSILHYTEAIFLPPSWGFYPNVVQIFFELVLSLLCRSKRFKQPEDAKCVVEYLRHLRGLPLDTFEVPHELVTKSLVQALAIQVELEAGGTRDIEEMVILCQELLTCHSSADYPTHAITALVFAILCKYCQGKQVQPLDGIIQCLRDALKILPPGSHLVLLGLVDSLVIRYVKDYSNGDYDEAMTLLESVIAFNPPGESTGASQAIASMAAAALARLRTRIYPNPQYLEEANSRLRVLLNSSSLDSDLRHSFTREMAMLAEERFNSFGLTEALQEAHYYTSEMVNLASSSAHGTFGEDIDNVEAVRAAYPMAVVEEKIQNLRKLISKTPPRSSERNEYLEHLVDWYRTKFSRTNDITDLEEVIKCRRCSNKMEYLDESIAVHRGVLEMQSAQPFHFILIQHLFKSLSERFMLLGRRQDLDDFIELFPLGVNDKFAKVPDRFAFSCRWAFITRAARHPSVSVAYEKAMSLIQSSLVSAPTLQIQHSRLVAMRGLCENMPLDYASYQIDMGQFSQAIETLERGRALLWSEMRGLRNLMDQLPGVNSPLVTKLAAINEDLESLTEISDGGSQVDDGMDPFGRLVVKQQKLLEEEMIWDFLKTPSFENIRVAASHGPVVIINHSEWRSDILILLYNSSPSCIPTTADFYRRANELRDRLVVARRDGLDSDRYERALRSVLEGLYNLVGEPVIDRLHTLGVPEQSRIWWCPTSVFCSLPLHAMGPIPSNDRVKRYFSDLYIPSYTPTLSALIESRKPSPKTSYKPSLLLVANPDESLPVSQSRVPVATLCGKNATPAGVVERLRDHGFAHFVCHGTLETGKPFDASFKLFNDERLTLLDIVRSRLPAGEFAFLAACHTAELTDESIADEGLHLTAAVQYCGFRSVVGTMWEMAI
ncbi:hypothetical protein B0F90DRAFT_1669097 [Multifurca ochricompacta]|uniref:CHAT domain-containing protein n=1 Tax=Multifurca ochricompacta TaxID=376703 RepID=A0AAD4QMB4_9AGAM|nr:hypothetical protein B0F90DRAFT_1669097 [Multifurca ochricompacta]